MENAFKDYFHPNPDGKVTHCHYCVATPASRPQETIVIFREAPGNPGAPLDKVRGEIATKVAQDLNTKVEALNWFEHKPDNTVEKHTFQRQTGYSKQDNDIALTGKTNTNDVSLAGKVERVVSKAVKMTVHQARKLIGWTLTPHDPLNPVPPKRRRSQQELRKPKPQLKLTPRIKPKP